MRCFLHAGLAGLMVCAAAAYAAEFSETFDADLGSWNVDCKAQMSPGFGIHDAVEGNTAAGCMLVADTTIDDTTTAAKYTLQQKPGWPDGEIGFSVATKKIGEQVDATAKLELHLMFFTGQFESMRWIGLQSFTAPSSSDWEVIQGSVADLSQAHNAWKPADSTYQSKLDEYCTEFSVTPSEVSLFLFLQFTVEGCSLYVDDFSATVPEPAVSVMHIAPQNGAAHASQSYMAYDVYAIDLNGRFLGRLSPLSASSASGANGVRFFVNNEGLTVFARLIVR